MLLVALCVGLGALVRDRRSSKVASRFVPGDRVRVTEPGYWADGAVGTIANPPSMVAQLAGDWHGHVRMVETTTGLRPFYWVVLDEARTDADGDGPYHEAEIAEASLRPLTSPSP